MKNLSMKTLIITGLVIVGLFGIVRADETTTTETAGIVACHLMNLLHV